MSKNQEITNVVEGKTVTGEITFRNESDISVKITKPHAGLIGGLNIPYFSRPYHSFMTDYGDRTAENLLKGLWELGSYMGENRKFLKLQLAFHFHHGDYSTDSVKQDFSIVHSLFWFPMEHGRISWSV